MRLLQSTLFRFAILIIAFFIIETGEILFAKWIYYALVFIYFAVFLYLRKKDFGLIRLVWDFLFLNILLLSNDIHKPEVFFLAFMPMVNAINFTGKKSHYFILVCLTIATLYFNLTQFELWVLLPMFSLILMYWISNIKYSGWEIEKDITNRVDSYFLSPVKMKSHQIYKGIIEDLNTFFKFEHDKGISRILVYTLKGNTLWLVNSSSFIWERNLIIPIDRLNQLKEKGYLFYNDKDILYYDYFIEREDIQYVFVCEIKEGNNSVLFKYRLKRFMDIAFNKISMLLNTEYRIQQRREEKFNEIKDSVLYVNQATRVMHFIRNKMTPLSNVIAYHKIEDTMPVQIKAQMKKRFGKEVLQAENDLKDILKYANYLLDKSNNPFAESEVSEIPIYKLFIVLSELAQSQFDMAVDTDVNLRTDILESRVVRTNLIQCKIMMTDWIENMRKNAGNYNSISMRFDDNELIIHFENSYSTNEDEIMKLVRDMNSTAKDAVLEGKNYGHGIYIIKSVAREFGITVNAKRDYNINYGGILSLDFKFTTYERKENSNI